MADPRLKVIRIKSGMVKRLTKEKSMYISEVEQQKVRVQKYKDEGKDEYEIRKQEEVLQECKMMVPQTHKLLATAFQNLKEILENESDLNEEDIYKTARAILEEARLAVEESAKFAIMAQVPYSNILPKGEHVSSTSIQTNGPNGCLPGEDIQIPQLSHSIQYVMDNPADSHFSCETRVTHAITQESCSENFQAADQKWPLRIKNSEQLRSNDQQMLSYYCEKRIPPSAVIPSLSILPQNVQTNFQSLTSVHEDPSIDPEKSRIDKEAEEVNADQEWIQSWILSRKGETHIPDSSAAISAEKFKVWEVKKTLQYVWKMLNELKILEKEMSANLRELPEREWDSKVEEINSIRDCVQVQLDSLEDSRLKRIKIALLKRGKKRRRLRKKRTLIRESLSEKAMDLKLAHLKIDLRLERRLEHIEDIKQEDEMKREADAVLWGVRQKQFEGRNILSLLSEIVKLFQIRLRKNEANDPALKDDEEQLDKIIDRLNNLWEDQMKDYEIEEQALRTMLEENREMSAEKEKKGGNKYYFRKRHITHKAWDAIIFGRNYSSKNLPGLEIASFKPFFSASLNSLESLIENRKNWDQHISNSSSASSIPMGWIIPKEATSEEWFNLIH